MYLFIIFFLIFILLFIVKFNINYFNNREKISPYECGFQEFDDLRKKFYLKFYLVSIIFLLFDLETLLLYPVSIYFSYLSLFGFNLYFYFLFLLSLGLAFEINKSIIIY